MTKGETQDDKRWVRSMPVLFWPFRVGLQNECVGINIVAVNWYTDCSVDH